MFATYPCPSTRNCASRHPRFNGATAWLAVYYTRTTSSTSGPPSAWSAIACTSTTCSGEANTCVDTSLCFGPDGTCRGDPLPAGTLCDDSHNTTANDQCDGAGTCTGTLMCADVNCPSATDCLKASTCFPTVGQCSLQVPKAVDTPCDDSDAGTKNDVCDGSGVCIGTADSGSSSSLAAVAGGFAAVVLCLCVVIAVISRRGRLAQTPRAEATIVNRGFDAPPEWAVGAQAASPVQRAGPDNLAAEADYEELPVAAYAQVVGTGGGWGFEHIEESQSNYAAPALYAAAQGNGGNYGNAATYAAMDGAVMDSDASIDV